MDLRAALDAEDQVADLVAAQLGAVQVWLHKVADGAVRAGAWGVDHGDERRCKLWADLDAASLLAAFELLGRGGAFLAVRDVDLGYPPRRLLRAAPGHH